MWGEPITLMEKTYCENQVEGGESGAHLLTGEVLWH